jgi:2',3'-cyclic-nucleotide 2'-phosphodiesterase (5'-nucleotidase family)
MKFHVFIILYLLLPSLAVSATAATATEKHLTLVFAGNMPDIGIRTYGTFSGLAGLLEKIRAESTPTIFMFAGGSLGPSPLSSLDRGSHIIDILNTLEPDLMTLTKREFSYFEDELTLRSYEAAFPIVSSNLFDPLIDSNLEGILTSLLVEKDNTKVGFISILDEEVVEEYLLKRVSVSEPRQVIQQQITLLKQKGAELIVLVYSKERDYYQTLISENQIDFALRVLNVAKKSRSNKVYTIASREPLMLLRMSWQANSPIKNLTIETPKISDSYVATDTKTSLLVDEYNQRLERLLNQKIGFFGSDTQTSRSLVRTMEMPLGNFIADALKHYAETDIGIINGGAIRGDKMYTEGSLITRRDIATELPFRSHVAVLSVTGQQLKIALENSVSKLEIAGGRFLQVSGISFTYSIKKPVGQRIQTVKINGLTLQPKQRYSVSTSDYLANGGDGYDIFLNTLHQKQSNQQPPLIVDVVIRMIQQQKVILPKVEFRIKRVIE